jgi:hypothetical protein
MATWAAAAIQVMLTGTLESFSQQYGFSTITITGVLLETSRVRRKTRTVL